MSFKDFLSGVPAAVSGLTVLVFTATAAREWTYYHVIGADFISLTSLADYTSASLRWLPGFVLAGMVCVVLEMFLSRTEGFQSEEEIAQRSPNPQRTRFFRDLPYYLALTLMIAGGFFYVARVDNPTAQNWVIPSMGCWIVFFRWFVRHPHVYDRLAKTGRWLLLLGPMAVALIMADGYDDAQGDLALPRGEYRIVHSADLVEDDIQLLRATSKGILILRVPTRDVSFLTYQSFKSIDRPGSSQ